MNIDEKYIDKLSPSLPKLQKVKDGVYRMRCIYCGNGETNPNKFKGYLYEKGESYNYRCHRCNARSSLKTIMKELNPELYLQYVTEKFQDIFTPTIEYSPEHKRITKT